MELVGWIKILDENGNFVEVRNLGQTPTLCKPGRAESIEDPPAPNATYNGTQWVVPEIPPPHPRDFPLTDRQLRIGLIVSGISLDTIDYAIDQIPDPLQKAIAKVWWDRSIKIEWDHAQTQALMGLVGLTEQQATTMWMAAKEIPA